MIVAIQHIRKMRGGAQSHLMLASDGLAYVVKFQNNPQHLRVLANEFLVTGIALELGLNVPRGEIIEVPQCLITNTRELAVTSETGSEFFKAGLQFGSLFVGGLFPGHTLDYLPETQLSDVTNLDEFGGILLLDKWTSNSDGRQAVFHKSLRAKRYKATFIDQGYCFDGGSWAFSDSPLRGVYARNVVYRDVKGWESFEPWLNRLQRMDDNTVWSIAEKLPEEWYGGPAVELEQLIVRLFERKSRVRDSIDEFRHSSREPFPQWNCSHKKKVLIDRTPVLTWDTQAESSDESD